MIKIQSIANIVSFVGLEHNNIAGTSQPTCTALRPNPWNGPVLNVQFTTVEIFLWSGQQDQCLVFERMLLVLVREIFSTQRIPQRDEPAFHGLSTVSGVLAIQRVGQSLLQQDKCIGSIGIGWFGLKVIVQPPTTVALRLP